MRLIRTLSRLAAELRSARDADQALRAVALCARRITGSDQATVRLLEADTGLLLVSARSGEPMHASDDSFRAHASASAIGWCVENARPLRIDDPASDPRFIQRPEQQWRPSAILAVPLLQGDRAMGVISVAVRDGPAYAQEDLEALVAVADIASPHLQIERLVSLAETDPLTRLYNRHHLAWRLPAALRKAMRAAEPLAAILLDLDHFGRINKEHGMETGDRALHLVGETLRSTSRGGDIPSRVGGEEFLLLLPGTNVEGATHTADRLRKRLATTFVESPEGDVSLSGSFGVGSVHPHDDLAAVLARLDAPMRRAKSEGRNRVRVERPARCGWDDFLEQTRAVWRRVPSVPDRGPDRVDVDGSRYWNTGDGVYREAEQWQEDLHGCTWLLDGRICREPAVAYAAYSGMVLQRRSA